MLGLLAAAMVALIFLRLSGTVSKQSAIASYSDNRVQLQSPATFKLRRPGVLVVGIGAALFTLSFFNNCFLSIPAAHVAAVFDPLRGGVQPTHLPEGFHIVPPWWKTQTFRVQTQEYTMSGTHSEGARLGDDSIRCQTNEGLGLDLDVTVLYHISPKAVDTLWRNVGGAAEYQGILVRPSTRNAIRMVVARYSVIDVYGTRRQQIEREITTQIKDAFASKGLELENVLLRNVEFANPEFAQAITDKQVAQQQINTEAQNLQKARIEKQTTVAQAAGEASAISKRGATLRDNPEVVQFEMAQKLAPRVRSLYLSPDYLPMLPRQNQSGPAKGGR